MIRSMTRRIIASLVKTVDDKVQPHLGLIAEHDPKLAAGIDDVLTRLKGLGAQANAGASIKDLEAPINDLVAQMNTLQPQIDAAGSRRGSTEPPP